MSQNELPARPKILCVDDDPTTLALYQKYLDPAKFEVETVANAEDGLARALKIKPDLIISDVVMPGDSGVDFCRRIRNERALAGAMFILASAHKKASADTVEGLEAGADDYLSKPIRKNEFLAKINAFLRIKALQDELFAANRNLKKAVRYLKSYKLELEKKNQALRKEKQIIENSLKQISLMVEERERTNQELAQLNEIHEENFASLITILSTIIESKRQYHRGHAKRVAEISTYLAREMRLNPKEIRNIEIAALLHELGKLALPDDLTMKRPQECSEQEKDFLMQHPVKGSQLLASFRGFGKVAQIIRHLHERYDGSGIPRGLRGGDIPLGARVIDAAGAFDNLIHGQSGLTVTEAFAEMESEVGTRFDPKTIHYLHKYASRNPMDQGPDTKELRIYELQPGMTLASGIFTVRGTKLLPINTVLTEESIKQIAQYHKIDPLEEKVFIRE